MLTSATKDSQHTWQCAVFFTGLSFFVPTFHIFHQHSESGFWTLQLRHGRILHVVELLVLSQIHRTTGVIQIHDLILYLLILFLQFSPQIRGFHQLHWALDGQLPLDLKSGNRTAKPGRQPKNKRSGRRMWKKRKIINHERLQRTKTFFSSMFQSNLLNIHYYFCVQGFWTMNTN